MANIGYIRVSTADQNTDRQLDGITLDKRFEDKLSGSTTDRPQLLAMIEWVREGDVVHVHSIDRLARSMSDLLKIVADLNAKGVAVRFHKEDMTFTGEDSPMQKLMLNMMGSFAQFEREVMKERQREGIAKAKEKGVYKGRVKTVDDSAILALLAEGKTVRAVAAELGVNPSTVQRAKKAALCE
ncbi:recombinase family protein [Pseudomonas guariconensis]|uniref:recombinase family protein n=1 Tax=Pseudomonas guariconensis TaxID=1288410 RepID=UPI0018AA8761|nr:recombinase family protein [Pseudomonas guariconensis]MBF8740224.1 recombinase family protein [Pseudomonas guariconensis]MBF8750367.1 recombinase family protein [Pseudomonas guariconensis]